MGSMTRYQPLTIFTKSISVGNGKPVPCLHNSVVDAFRCRNPRGHCVA